MKEMPMTNVVSDSAGQIFATKRGELRIIAASQGKIQWRKGGQQTELVRLEPSENRYLVYREPRRVRQARRGLRRSVARTPAPRACV